MSQHRKRRRESTSNIPDSKAIISERLQKLQGPGITFVKSPMSTESNKKNNDLGNPFTSNFGRCPDVSSRYKKLGRIGQGTYGIVYKALDLVTSRTVALKRCLPHNEKSDGFPITTLREIQTLREIEHKNIVKLLEIAVSSKQSGVFLVFEYLHFDLANVIDEHYAKHKRSPFSIPEIKCLSAQLFSALDYLHSRCIVHRDLKLSNLLYDRDKGQLKIADFGLCRKIPESSSDPEKSLPLTPKVVSLWYRPPELLLGSETYNFSIDIWGAACVIAEFLFGVPIFNGKTEVETLQKIVDLLGPPTVLSWPQISEMPLLNDGKQSEIKSILDSKAGSRKCTSSTFIDTFSDLSPSGITLLRSLLRYDPNSRWTTKMAISCKWFTEDPLPCNEAHMPSFANKKIP